MSAYRSRNVAVTLALVMSVLVSAVAHAGSRVALVIGNSGYTHAAELTNPKNDAADMVAALKAVGFHVIEGFDLDKVAFDRKIRDFAAALAGADVGLFFYSGHGLQVGGRNYLVPIDAELSTTAALEFEMVQLDVIHRVMEGQANTNILFLDACRNNPLARNLARAMGSRSAEIARGLAPVEGGVGTLISFSTQPGNVALDGSGRNSPFAGALVRHIANSSDSLSDLLIAVRNEVRKETEGRQVPWEHSALTGRFYFKSDASMSPTGPELPSATTTEWSRLDKTSIAELETFLRRHGSSAEAEYARARLAELKKQVTPASVPERKAEYLFDGTWRLTGTGDKNCTLKTWHWRDPIRITRSHIEGRGGTAKGRVSEDGSFKIIVQSKGVGTFTGAFRGDSGEGSFTWSDSGCSGAFALKRF